MGLRDGHKIYCSFSVFDIQKLLAVASQKTNGFKTMHSLCVNSSIYRFHSPVVSINCSAVYFNLY